MPSRDKVRAWRVLADAAPYEYDIEELNRQAALGYLAITAIPAMADMLERIASHVADWEADLPGEWQQTEDNLIAWLREWRGEVDDAE